MSTSFRVLIATQDIQMRLTLEALLKAVRAQVIHASTEDLVLTYLKTPEGFDLLVVDAAWEQLSIHSLHLACRSRSKGKGNLSETHLLVLLPTQDTVHVVGAFNDGADAVLRQPIRPLEFLNACRNGQRLAQLTRSQRALETEDEVSPAPLPVEDAISSQVILLKA